MANITEVNKVKRMKYFNGLFLTDEEFNLEQNYHIRMRRLHNRHLHTWGIVWGLDVVAVESKPLEVKVTQGMALNKAKGIETEGNKNEDISQEIVLTEDATLVLVSDDIISGVYIYLDFKKVEIDVLEQRGGTKEIHWLEDAAIGHTTSINNINEDEGQLILAKVENAAGTVGEGSIIYFDNSTPLRTYAGAFGNLTLPIEKETPDETQNQPRIEGKKIESNGTKIDGIKVDSLLTEFTGDIKVGGKLDGNLAADIIDTVQIKDNAVTAAKIKDGSVGTDELANDAVTAAKIKDGSVGTDELANDAVTAAKIKDGSVGTDELANDAVTAVKIKDGSIGTDELANDAVTAVKIKDGSVGTDELANDAVTAVKIKDGSVGTDELANDAVTEAKLEQAIRDKLATVVTPELIQEIKDARGIKSTLGNRLDESLTKGGQLRSNVVGMDQLIYEIGCQIIPRIYRVPLLQQTLFSRPVPAAIVTVGEKPYGVAFDGNYIWVANAGSNKVSKIDIINNIEVATVEVGNYPWGVAFDGTHIWVANSNDNNVSKIDIINNTVVATVRVGDYPIGVAFDGKYIWVVSQGSSEVSKINIGNNTVVAKVAVGSKPYYAAFDGKYIWVVSFGSSIVSKIDIINNAVAAKFEVGNNPLGIAFDGKYMWVVSRGSREVSKIDIINNTIVAKVAVGINPWGVAFDGTHIWVANSNDKNVSKIDIINNTVVATVEVGVNPTDVAFDGIHIWVANLADSNVTKI